MKKIFCLFLSAFFVIAFFTYIKAEKGDNYGAECCDGQDMKQRQEEYDKIVKEREINVKELTENEIGFPLYSSAKLDKSISSINDKGEINYYWNSEDPVKDIAAFYEKVTKEKPILKDDKTCIFMFSKTIGGKASNYFMQILRIGENKTVISINISQ